MKRNPSLVLLVAFVAASLSPAHGLGLHPTMFFVAPGAPRPEAERVERVGRTRLDRSAPFVVSTFDRGMIDAFSMAWSRAGGGLDSTEGVVLILRMAHGGYSARSLGFSNEYKAFTFPWHPATVAIIHTHPNKSSARPEGEDLNVADRYGVPIFTITNRGMYVYDPATRRTSKVKDGLDWLDASKWPERIAQKR
ncbi:MAG: hypothetical protein WAU45_06455 [Blastocatellia bacterium]